MLGISSLFWSQDGDACSRCLRLLMLLTVPFSLAVASEIEVIGTGTGRTGSTTLHEALTLLGYKTYHMREIMMGSASQDVKMSHMDFWFSAYDTNCSDPNTLRQLFAEGEYRSTVHAIHYPCLDRLIFDLYPNAKVIHTQRTDANLWHDSVTNSICGAFEGSLIMKLFQVVNPVMKRFKSFIPILMGHAIFGLHGPVYNVTKEYCLAHKEQMVAHYNAHNARIRDMVPKDRLLIIENHKEGWKPLCEFLGKPVPNMDFPHINKRDAMLRTMVGMVWKNILNRPFVAAGGVGVFLVLVAILAWSKQRKMKRE